LVNLHLLDGVYSDDYVGFSYPARSEKDTIQTSAGPAFILFLPGGGGINFTVLTPDLSLHEPPVTLQEFTEANREDFGTQVTNPEVISEGSYQIDGQPAYQRTWKGTRIDGSGVVFEYWQAWTVVNKKAYLFGISGPSEEVKEFQKVAKSIVESVKFK